MAAGGSRARIVSINSNQGVSRCRLVAISSLLPSFLCVFLHNFPAVRFYGKSTEKPSFFVQLFATFAAPCPFYMYSEKVHPAAVLFLCRFLHDFFLFRCNCTVLFLCYFLYHFSEFTSCCHPLFLYGILRHFRLLLQYLTGII